jgi:hypothetical protein
VNPKTRDTGSGVTIEAVLGGLMLGASIVIYRSGLGLTFYYDEWNFVLGRGGWNVDTFLVPHNEHLLLVPVVVFKLLFVTAGLDSYWAYRLVPLGFHLLCVGLLFVYVRRRRGEWVALVASVPVLCLGAAWHALLVPLNLGFLAAVAAGLGALLVLERGDRRGDAAACILLILGLASSSVGISFAAAALVEILSLRWRSLWVFALPAGLYGIWFLEYGNPDAVSGADRGVADLLRSNLPAAPGYFFNAAAGAFGGLVGLSLNWGRLLAVLAGIALAVKVSRATPFSARSVGLLAAATTYWGLMALFRAHLQAPADSRYLYFGGILIVLLTVELMPSIQPSRGVLAAAAVVLAGIAVSSFALLHDGSRFLQSWSKSVRAELAALEVAGPTTDPGYRPDEFRAPGITAGPYFAAVSDWGSPAFTAEEVERLAEPERQEADAVLVAALGVSIQRLANAAPGGPRPAVDAATGGRVGFRSRCVTFVPRIFEASIELTVPAAGVAFTATGALVEVGLRSFAGNFSETSVDSADPGLSYAVRIPSRPGRTWHVRLATSGPLTACGLRGKP